RAGAGDGRGLGVQLGLDLLRPRLKPGAVIDEEPGAAYLCHVLGRGLPIVGLGAGRHEGDDPRAVARHLPREFGHGIYARDDERPGIGGGRLLAACCGYMGDDGQHETVARRRSHAAAEPPVARVTTARTSRMRPKAQTTVAPVGKSRMAEAAMATTLTNVPKAHATASRLPTGPPRRFAASVGTIR